MISRRQFLGSTAALAGAAAIPLTASPATAAGPARPGPLTNLAHLRWLLDTVPLVETSVHTTWEIGSRPAATAPWTYANALPEGGFARVGGGSLDPTTGYWAQGAYNADDIARAAVVFTRAWRAGGGGRCRADAIGLLRTLTYLQDATGPHAGDVVLWMQADGTLNTTPQPPDAPDPSDSGESYWLARTVWALGEGYAALVGERPIAGFLRDRLHLALDALDRGCLSHYGSWLVADDVRVPAWLVVGGADATAEACLGLAAYVAAAPHDRRARTALTRLASGVAAMRSGGTGTWPFGAILPSTTTQSLWHAWGGEAPQALCRAAALLGDPGMRAAGLADAGSFTPQLLTAGGPHNSWSPMPGEAQIAYGAEGRVSGLLAAADLTGSDGFVQLGGLAGGWFFGANTSGQATYDPKTGVTNDGVEVDGRINVNAGAESTIHGQLAMLALDAHPEAAAIARSVRGYSFDGLQVVEAEGGALSGGAVIVTPSSAWTGAANWSGGAYVSAQRGAAVRMEVTGHDGASVYVTLNRRVGDLGRSRCYAVDSRGRWTLLGRIDNGGLEHTGIVPADGLLSPVSVGRPLPAGTVAVVVRSDGDLQLDALLLQPAVATVRYETSHGPVVLYANASTCAATVAALAPGRGHTWSADGAPRGTSGFPHVSVTGGGFAVTR
ncbi:MAG: hypothetical protein ABI083_01500 [Lapillicoccus sp.]